MIDWGDFTDDEIIASREILQRIDMCISKMAEIYKTSNDEEEDVIERRSKELKAVREKILMAEKDFEHARQVVGRAETFIKLAAKA